ncbi:MAG: FkbM family methyltransferase, partial [Porticoccaceae bacterium]
MTASGKTSFFGSYPLRSVLNEVAPLECMDIGARGGPTKDLLPLAEAVHLYGFEPDKTECTRLNDQFSASPAPFGSMRFFPVALSEKGGKRTLNLTRHRGASTLLTPKPQVGERFSRSRYTDIDEQIPIETVPLGSFATDNNLDQTCFLKIDVEGLELEILKSAENLLRDRLMVVRTEVAFLPIREAQPLYCDIDCFLKQFDFVPMGFGELHHWRRFSSEKHLKWTRGRIPFSRGQIAHGDMIFFRDPDSIETDSDQGARDAIKCAFFAIIYGFLDHAAYLLTKPSTTELLQSIHPCSIEKELARVAKFQASQQGRMGLSRWFGNKRRNRL